MYIQLLNLLASVITKKVTRSASPQFTTAPSNEKHVSAVHGEISLRVSCSSVLCTAAGDHFTSLLCCRRRAARPGSRDAIGYEERARPMGTDPANGPRRMTGRVARFAIQSAHSGRQPQAASTPRPWLESPSRAPSRAIGPSEPAEQFSFYLKTDEQRNGFLLNR